MAVDQKHRILFFAGIIICTQLYLGILSTQHALHNMPPSCPICALSGHLDDTIVHSSQPHLIKPLSEPADSIAESSHIIWFVSAYFSRAPPPYTI